MDLFTELNGTNVSISDPALDAVRRHILSIKNFESIVGISLRKAFDEVIDCARTGRYEVDQLEKTEKTYIGTKVEIVLRAELELGRGEKLDNLIEGVEVDTKFSISGEWMIPKEAIGEICLLVSADDYSSKFSVGLIRATREVLRPGTNQDSKTSFSSFGKKKITWLIKDHSFPQNFLLNLAAPIRETILNQRYGVGRVRELFMNVTGRIIPRTVIEQVVQKQDFMKRARERKDDPMCADFEILCAKYKEDREKMFAYGFQGFAKNDWLSMRRARN